MYVCSYVKIHMISFTNTIYFDKCLLSMTTKYWGISTLFKFKIMLSQFYDGQKFATLFRSKPGTILKVASQRTAKH